MSAIILLGDVRTRLAEIPDASVQTCITSPPYWGLRDYGTATWLGGEEGCDHQGKPFATKSNINKNTNGGNDKKNSTDREFYKSVCGKCGAERIDNQLGLEETPQEYVDKMVEVFREVKRVLRDDGTLWLNLGDSYAGSGAGGGGNRKGNESGQHDALALKGRPSVPSDLKPKDLVGIPWRVAFALQADGWYLRQDIIWAKPNPMPESVTDRCTKSHEYLFLLSKSAKYYFDNQAIKEPAVTNVGDSKIRFGGNKYGDNNDPKHATKSGNVYVSQATRNKRDVWNIAPKPFKGAHFAVMPEALVEPCILAGSRIGDTVLDPFAGSGTVGVVALRHDRDFVGIELSPKYAQIALERIGTGVEVK